MAKMSKSAGGWTSFNHFMYDDTVQQIKGSSGSFGQLEFVGDTKRRLLNLGAAGIDDARQAKFCRVRVQRDVSRLLLSNLRPEEGEKRIDVVRGLVDYIKYGWKVPMPTRRDSEKVKRRTRTCSIARSSNRLPSSVSPVRRTACSPQKSSIRCVNFFRDS